MDSNVDKYPQGCLTPASSVLPLNSNDPQPQRHLTCAAMESDGLADLSLFRSHSMPIPTFSGRGAGSDQFHRSLEDQDEEDEEEDDEDDDDLLATPPFMPPQTKNHPSCQRLLSCSLPPSLDRRKVNSSHPQHENALHEFFQLTQPMREGLISREKLLPSSRMKQVGIGGRGRRALSTHKKPQNLLSPTSEFMKIEQESDLLSPTKLDQSLRSPGSSSSMYQQSTNNNLSSSIGSNGLMTVHSQFAQVPLIRPRPVLAWDHSSRQLSKKENTASNAPESNYQTIH